MIFQKNSFIVIFSFWRQLYIFYHPSLDKYNSCLCRTITGIFSTRKIARTCFCCPISLITRWKHRFCGGGRTLKGCDFRHRSKMRYKHSSWCWIYGLMSEIVHQLIAPLENPTIVVPCFCGCIPSPKLTVRTWKWMVGRLVSFLLGWRNLVLSLFQGWFIGRYPIGSMVAYCIFPYILL